MVNKQVLTLISLSIFLSVCINPLKAQRRIDSLRTLVGRANGKEKIDALNRLAQETSIHNTSESKLASKQAYLLSEKLAYPKGKATALMFMSFPEYNVGKWLRSDSLLKESIRLSHKSNERAIEGYAWACLAASYQYRGLLDSAKQYLLKSLDLFEIR